MVSLIKQVDAAVAADPAKKERGFVAFLGEPSDALKKQLADLAEKEKIAIPLVINDAGTKNPEGYALSGDAYATVLVYSKHKVKQNFALREGEIDAKAIAAIVEATKKLVDPGLR